LNPSCPRFWYISTRVGGEDVLGVAVQVVAGAVPRAGVAVGAARPSIVVSGRSTLSACRLLVRSSTVSSLVERVRSEAAGGVFEGDESMH
jgi:hypothetical protein